MRYGFTLVDLILGLTLVTIVAGIAIPKLQLPLDRLAVERAVYDMGGSHLRARSTAIARNRVTLLRVTSDSVQIRVLSGPDTLTVWTRHGASNYGVSVSGPTHWLRFQPSGIGYGFGNGTWTFSRGSIHRRVIISRLGRLRVVP